MAVTILAVVFLFLLVAIAFAGVKILGRGGKKQENADSLKCSLCRRSFEESRMITRQIGDYRLFHFCRDCVLSLYADLGLKN
jgi:hypothetical protein